MQPGPPSRPGRPRHRSALCRLPSAGRCAISRMTRMHEVAALFVRRGTPYAGLGCDCYDMKRDALTWQGGMPGVFHPPCRAWGQLAHFAKPREGERELALWAMEQCRKWGGVVEHPFASGLWNESGCIGFGLRDRFGGVLVPVLQSWWGHRAPKKTCLYIVGPVPELPFDGAMAEGRVERMGKAERERTPAQFAEFLVGVARSCAMRG